MLVGTLPLVRMRWGRGGRSGGSAHVGGGGSNRYRKAFRDRHRSLQFLNVYSP